MNILFMAIMLWMGAGDNSSATAALDWQHLTQVAQANQTNQANPSPNAPPVISPETTKAPEVKGIYVTAHSAAGSRMTQLLKLVDDTELNAMVIDVKDDWGTIMYKTGNPKLEAYGTTLSVIKDMPALMTTLKQHNIYPIARIVVFKDSTLPKSRPDLSFRDGKSIWKNRKGESFVNPYAKEVWEYNVEVAKEAAKAGFKEIQFDYVRFPEGFEKRADKLTYTKLDETRVNIVSDFVAYAKKELEPLGVKVSVDIFGYAASVPAAEGIGQDFVKISQNVDVISPMVYPSHYGTGWFGKSVPDAYPYNTILGAMTDTHKKLDPLGEKAPIIRPWIQDFTAKWIKGHISYGKKEVEEQIRALHDSGIKEYLLWNANNNYTTNASFK